MAIELATGYVNLVPSAKGITDNLASALGAPLASAAASSGNTASAGFVSAFMGGAGKLPGLVKGLIAGAGIAAPVVLLEKLGATFDEQFDKIRLGTGATGTALSGLEDDFRAVARSGPSSFSDVSDAITDVSRQLGLTGKPLEDTSRSLLDLSRITGTDLKTNLKAASGLFNQFGVSAGDQTKKLDVLFRISQQTGVSVSDLATSMASGGAQFRAAGFTFESTGALLGLLAKNGLDAGSVIPALSRAMATAAKDGKPAQQVFQDTFDAIRNAPTDTAAAGVALDVFGAKAGPKFAALIREGKLSYQEFAQAVSDGGDTISQAALDTDDWGQKLDTLKNNVLLAFEPVATTVFEGLNTLIDKVAPGLTIASQAVAAFFAGFTGNGPGVLHGRAAEIANFAAGIRDSFDRALPGIGRFFRGLGDALAPVITDGLPKLRDLVVDVLTFIGDHHAVVDLLSGAVRVLGENLNIVLPAALAFVVALKGFSIASAAATQLSILGAVIGPLVEGLGALGAVIVGVFGAPVLITVGIIAAVAAGLGLLYLKVQPVHDAFDALGRFFAGAFRASLDWIVNVAWPALQSGAAGVARAFSSLSDLGAPIAAGVAQIASAFGSLGRMTLLAWRTVRTAIQPVIDWYQEHVGPTIAAVVEFVVALWDRLTQATSAAWNLLAPYVAFALRALVAIVAAVLGGILEIFQAVFGAIAPLVSAAFGIIVAVTQASLGVLAAIVSPVLALIIGAFQVFGGLIVDVLRITFDLAVAIIGGALDIIRGIFEILTAILTLDWSKAWQGVQDIVAGAWGIITGIIGAGAAAVEAITNAFLALVVLVFQTTWDLVTGIITAAWAGIQGITQAAVNAVFTIISTVFNLIVGVVQGVWDAIAGGVAAAWGTIQAEVSAAVNAVKDEIGRVIDGAKQLVLDAWNAIRDAVPAAWDEIKNAVTTAWGNVETFLRTIPGLAATALAGFGSAVIGALVQPFIDAYNAALGWWHKIQDLLHNTETITPNITFAPGTFGGGGTGGPGLVPTAVGRLVTGPTPLLAGEAGTEAILNDRQSARAIWNIANAAALPAASSAGPGQTLLQFGPNEINERIDGSDVAFHLQQMALLHNTGGGMAA
jgi:TP901 family phage tail tape measure protein